MFADETNLFLSGINVDDFFSNMDCEFVREPLTFLKIDDIAIETENVTQFLDVLPDENLSWKQPKNIKKHWYPLQIQSNSKTTFINSCIFLSFTVI